MTTHTLTCILVTNTNGFRPSDPYLNSWVYRCQPGTRSLPTFLSDVIQLSEPIDIDFVELPRKGVLEKVVKASEEQLERMQEEFDIRLDPLRAVIMECSLLLEAPRHEPT